MSSSKPQTIILITGANQGIGYETAKNLLSSPNTTHHILLGSRDLAKGVAAATTLREQCKGKSTSTVEAIQIDVTDDASVDAAAQLVKATHGSLDVLVNNAGVGSRVREERGCLRAALRRVLDVNLIGAVSVTEAFLPLLRAAARGEGGRGRDRRVVFVGSTTGSLRLASDVDHVLHGAGAMDYRTSKAALSMVIVQYWTLLEGEGIKVIGVNPGLIGTQGFHGGRKVGSEPEVGGERVACVVRGERDGDVGRVVTGDGVGGGVLPW